MAGIPGFPILKSGKIPAPITSVISAAIGSLWSALFPGERWGIYESGSETSKVEVDSVVELGLNGSAEASTYKIEAGSFVSYNKVRNPNAFMIRISKEGNAATRAYINEWLATSVEATTVFDVVMPEKRYNGYTLVEYRMLRSSASGAGMIVADLMIQEMRETSALYSNSKISDANNVPPTPTARVQLGEAVEPIKDVQWQ
jgi:hypothetical protein